MPDSKLLTSKTLSPFLLGACAALLFITMGCVRSASTSQDQDGGGSGGGLLSIFDTPTATPTQTSTVTPTPTQTLTPTPVPNYLVGAGEIDICGNDGDMQTAKLLERIPGQIFTAGDNSFENGTIDQYIGCFSTAWGRFFDRLHPSMGSHDINFQDDSGYYEYFGDAAGEPGKGYYSFDYEGWHLVALNSNCGKVNCSMEGEQIAWLKADLESHPNLCTLAYFHRPRWSSSTGGNDDAMDSFWQVLYEHGVDVVVNGFGHHYERFAPQDPQGKADPEKGIREFVVGTGGADLEGFGEIQPNSEVRDSTSLGVIRFLLQLDGYDWEFVPAGKGSLHDKGSAKCH